MSNSISPGAALLRSSRMFSVPKPLPSPLAEAYAVGRHHSPTMTMPYPTHQSITTPEHSRVLGDWGFKRPLPLRSTTKSSTPVVRIHQIDCFENVTDYSSAADHTISLQKFQELNLPMTLPGNNRFRLSGGKTSGKSVFEDDGDFTTKQPGRQNEEKRWKFKGPWLAGLTEGEFDHFLRYKVRNRREEFRRFAKERLASEMNAEAHRKAMHSGKKNFEKVEVDEITEAQLTQYFRKLRSDRVTLYSMVGEFLDLAPLQPPVNLAKYNPADKNKRPGLYAENGPPMSHPSGGISYLRTAAFAENHPVYGPQASHSPVLARIVSPRNGPTNAKLGVGGFVTDVPQGDSNFNQRNYRGGSKNLVAGVATFDPDITGGAKAYVEPVSAQMTSSGSVEITVNEANEEAQLIQKELIGRAKIYNDNKTRPEPQSTPRQPLGHVRVPLRRLSPQRTVGSSQAYGLDS